MYDLNEHRRSYHDIKTTSKQGLKAKEETEHPATGPSSDCLVGAQWNTKRTNKYEQVWHDSAQTLL